MRAPCRDGVTYLETARYLRVDKHLTVDDGWPARSMGPIRLGSGGNPRPGRVLALPSSVYILVPGTGP